MVRWLLLCLNWPRRARWLRLIDGTTDHSRSVRTGTIIAAVALPAVTATALALCELHLPITARYLTDDSEKRCASEETDFVVSAAPHNASNPALRVQHSAAAVAGSNRGSRYEMVKLCALRILFAFDRAATGLELSIGTEAARDDARWWLSVRERCAGEFGAWRDLHDGKIVRLVERRKRAAELLAVGELADNARLRLAK